jgi:hypothetical protein
MARREQLQVLVAVAAAVPVMPRMEARQVVRQAAQAVRQAAGMAAMAGRPAQ